jgi:murein DD-endopeptidase MepM/ murein hydrolase activator NlpD
MAIGLAALAWLWHPSTAGAGRYVPPAAAGVSGSGSLAALEGTGPGGPPPFGLPFEGEPGPSTWLIGQPYGNTTGAYRRGDLWYAAGQRLHFGLDILARCGTPVISIGDGIVVQADWLARGSGPHNLVVRHDNLGVTVLYGHLLERPSFGAGDPVARGEQVGLSGDPDVTCDSRPHLHLEIRTLDYRTAYNPLLWIDADWDAAMLLGPFSDVQFARDLSAPQRWVRPEDQPDVQFGGPPANLYENGWPEEGADALCVVIGC